MGKYKGAVCVLRACLFIYLSLLFTSIPYLILTLCMEHTVHVVVSGSMDPPLRAIPGPQGTPPGTPTERETELVLCFNREAPLYTECTSHLPCNRPIWRDLGGRTSLYIVQGGRTP